MGNKIIKLIVGFPASGKSRFVQQFVEQGYMRLNRDELGGSLKDIVKHLEIHSKKGISQFCLDNTYTTEESRAVIIEWAKNNNFDVECFWMTTDVANCQYNVVVRMIDKYGKLLMPEEIKERTKEDPGIYPPAPIFKARKNFDKPKLDEGFAKLEKIPFVRELDLSIYTNRAIILDYDGTLRKTKSGDKYPISKSDVEILPKRREILEKYKNKGYLLLGVSNQSGVIKGNLTFKEVDEIFKYTNQVLGIEIEYKFCPHGFFPQVCYCRKPIPGLGVEFIEKYKLDPAQCIMVGDLKTDNTFADRCGFQYKEAKDFFEV